MSKPATITAHTPPPPKTHPINQPHVWHARFSQWDGAPSGRYAGWLGRLHDRRLDEVDEGRSDDVDPPDEPGGRVPVPHVLGREGRRVRACGVGAAVSYTHLRAHETDSYL